MAVNFGRILTAMVTPFNDDLSINFSQAKKLAQHLITAGSDGLVIAGTTGESPTLSKDEKLELFQKVVDEVGGKAVVVAGTGSNSTADSIALTRAAEKTGVDGVMLVVPYYNKPSQEGLYQHFKAIAESTSLPIILYNIPGRTGINLQPATVARLAQISNIVAIKEASGIMDQVSELRKLLPDDFAIYSGDDSLTLPMLALGGTGVISVASHLVGIRMKEMVTAFISGDTSLAQKIHLELFPLFKGIFITTNPVPVKTALNLLGWEVGGTRPPLAAASASEEAAIKDMLAGLKLI
ncbi:MAG: 4-hydroxy-tetrahydrodipicolinate synthase [Peptococcaceae bacterium]|nr:4-hydroxy-tetrahydrodipicolinate synthase [Peptococcaceae bacterium]